MQEIAYYQSPIGNIAIKGQNGKIISLEILETPSGNNNSLPEYLAEAVAQLDAYFKGTLKDFNLPFENKNVPVFTKAVWDALINIPYGKAYSYGEVAKNIGNEKAARAVGNACNRNPLPIIVPCHRVVGSNGAMTGFALGIATKEWLLAHEAKYSAMKQSA